MSETWHEPYENQNTQLLEELETLFDATYLGQLSDDRAFVDGIYGKVITGYDDNALRMTLANWHTKSRIVVEKPLPGAGESLTKSLFADEHKSISFNIYIFDLLQENIKISESACIDGKVDYLNIEVYEDGRLALLYFGWPSENQNDDEYEGDDESYYEDDDEGQGTGESEVNSATSTNVVPLLGVDYSEQGVAVHSQIVEFIRAELGIDLWQDKYRESLESSIDEISKYCSENDK